MIFARAGVDEGHNALLVKPIELVNPPPGIESDRAIHVRVRRQDNVLTVAADDIANPQPKILRSPQQKPHRAAHPIAADH
jgi:hypothetical protein